MPLDPTASALYATTVMLLLAFVILGVYVFFAERRVLRLLHEKTELQYQLDEYCKAHKNLACALEAEVRKNLRASKPERQHG